MKTVKTHGITGFEPLDAGREWYWGTDFAAGDLYEAEEIFRQGEPLKQNRVLFLHFPEGEVLEPFQALSGQYLGRPVFHDQKIFILLVDFSQETLHILSFEPQSRAVSTEACLPLSLAKDCYNLLLSPAPLMLTRSGGENRFEILWPEQASFAIGPREVFVFREGERLYFQEWFEDPDYREEVLVRHLHTGEVLERFPGSLQEMPDGRHWLFA